MLHDWSQLATACFCSKYPMTVVYKHACSSYDCPPPVAEAADSAVQRGQSRADFMTAYQSATEQAGSMVGGFGEQLPATVPSDLQGRKELESDVTASTSAGVNSNGMGTGERSRLTLSSNQNSDIARWYDPRPCLASSALSFQSSS